MAIDVLVAEAQGLSEDALMEVIRFVRFIKNEKRSAISDTDGGKAIRSAGKYRGKIQMAEDFDDPLEDFKEYM